MLDVLHVCEIWCLTLKKEYKLWEYVNRVLKKVTVHTKAKVSRQFRTLCDENLCVYTGYQLLLWYWNFGGNDGQSILLKMVKTRSVYRISGEKNLLENVHMKNWRNMRGYHRWILERFSVNTWCDSNIFRVMPNSRLWIEFGDFILTLVPCIFYYFVQYPTNAQLIDKLLYCSYMSRH